MKFRHGSKERRDDRETLVDIASDRVCGPVQDRHQGRGLIESAGQ